MSSDDPGGGMVSGRSNFDMSKVWPNFMHILLVQLTSRRHLLFGWLSVHITGGLAAGQEKLIQDAKMESKQAKERYFLVCDGNLKIVLLRQMSIQWFLRVLVDSQSLREAKTKIIFSNCVSDTDHLTTCRVGVSLMKSYKDFNEFVAIRRVHVQRKANCRANDTTTMGVTRILSTLCKNRYSSSLVFVHTQESPRTNRLQFHVLLCFRGSHKRLDLLKSHSFQDDLHRVPCEFIPPVLVVTHFWRGGRELWQSLCYAICYSAGIPEVICVRRPSNSETTSLSYDAMRSNSNVNQVFFW